MIGRKEVNYREKASMKSEILGTIFGISLIQIWFLFGGP